MKKSARSNRRSKSKEKAAASAADTALPHSSRRAFLRNSAIGVVVVGGAGWFGARSVQATMAEHDLTRIGQGIPTVVQIHDPNCPVCRALQREVRSALKGTDDTRLTYLVANIKSQEGSALAGHYGVPHITLLLFNAEGELLDILRGPNERDQLQPVFDALALPANG